MITVIESANKIRVTELKLGEHFVFLGKLYVRVPGPNPGGQAGTSVYAYQYMTETLNTIPTVFMQDQSVTRVTALDITATV